MIYEMIFHKNTGLHNKILISYGSYIISGLILYFILYVFYQYHYSIKFISFLACLYVISIMILLHIRLNQYWTKQFKQQEESHHKQLALLRHDVKGILTPALLMTDRILLNRSADEKIIQSAETIAESIEKTASYLNQTKNSP